MKDRLGYVDFLKFVGLACIILAHTHPAPIVSMIRNFDVPLMIILSAVLANNSFQRFKSRNMPLQSYFISRFKRLVIPTWLFLAIYFSLYRVFSGHFYSLELYLYSFGLTHYGISYVWIILIYLYCAFLVPLFDKVGFSKKVSIIIFAVYIAYEIAFHYKLGTQNRLIYSTIYHIIPYGVLTYLGFNYKFMKRKTKIALTFESFAIFVALAIYYWTSSGAFQLVNIAKFPPRIYFLSYGIACSFFGLQFCEKYNLRVYNNYLVRYVSSHSLWIYLWHILILTIYEVMYMPEVWYIKFPVVFASAVFIVWLVNFILDKIQRKFKFSLLSYFRG